MSSTGSDHRSQIEHAKYIKPSCELLSREQTTNKMYANSMNFKRTGIKSLKNHFFHIIHQDDDLLNRFLFTFMPRNSIKFSIFFFYNSSSDKKDQTNQRIWLLKKNLRRTRNKHQQWRTAFTQIKLLRVMTQHMITY